MNQPNNTIAGSTVIVTGASRGFGRGIAEAFTAAGAEVIGVARSGGTVTADAADPATAHRLIERYQPRTVVLCAGAAPRMSPLQEQTWESFSRNWNVDVAQAFHWVREALLQPLAPGSTVIAVSSGAAINGSPLSGGYAGAKATVRLIAAYAALESQRAGLGIDFVSVLPTLTPSTELGAQAVAAYAERQGVDVEEFVLSLPAVLTAEQVGKSVLELATAGPQEHRAYTLSSAGLSPLG
ncbi:NAD(P)-dependent dehydrogenase (short-subunit alcohol dehydrogenase family) [Mycobacterium sp. OAS707]|uniref:SDR family oxidoreductase n=1 Tax=Mycobacterium sp. OAS707 TaxID=2663822 RepID=UPI00178BCCB7|nr:SDR family oxidoreductase [Mycobacterium sp. OAS707]MBE1550624.1 NAD(P)-dependent dehydrogenase (short-subunit alcohol dehydrogenase family) [Mycobacterium sp. OAS707]